MKKKAQLVLPAAALPLHNHLQPLHDSAVPATLSKKQVSPSPCRHFVQPRPGGDSAMQRNEFLHYCNFFHLHLNCESSKETFIAKPLTLCPLHCTVMRKLHGIPLHPPPVLLQRGLFIGHLWRLLPSSISPPLRKKEKKVPLI